MTPVLNGPGHPLRISQTDLQGLISPTKGTLTFIMLMEEELQPRAHAPLRRYFEPVSQRIFGQDFLLQTPWIWAQQG